MKIEIPFIKSRGFECGQACAAMIIKHFDPNFKPNFEEINKIIRHKKGKYTFPLQLAILLNSYKLKTMCFSAEDYKTQKEDPNQFQRWLGKDYPSSIKYIDHKMFDWISVQGKRREILNVKKSNFNELLKHFKSGHIVAMPLDWNTLIKKAGAYAGHLVIVTGVCDNDVYIHDPDVGPFQKYPISQLKKAWEHPAITDDYLIVYGKR